MRFKVRGGSAFPLDMLRYDSCWPASQEDVAKISATLEASNEGPVVVELEQASDARLTARRWESFLWRVVDEHDDGHGWA